MKGCERRKQPIDHKDITNPHGPEGLSKPDCKHLVSPIYFLNHRFDLSGRHPTTGVRHGSTAIGLPQTGDRLGRSGADSTVVCMALLDVHGAP